MADQDLTERKADLSAAKRALLQRRLSGARPKAATTEGISARQLNGPQPLSYTQQRVWFLQQLFPDNRAYNMSEAWRLRGPLDVGRLRAALQRIVERHPSLRTGFIAPENEPLQVVTEDVRIDLTVSDISHLPPQEREDALRDLVLAAGNHAFALDRPPLLRASLVRVAEDEHVLQLVLHHIITDEWSNDIIWQELATFYERDPAPDLPAPAIDYTDYAYWQREQMSAGNWDEQMQYWRAHLAGDLPVMPLPADRQRPAEQSLRGGTIRQVLPASLLEGVKALSQQEGTTLYTTLLAAFQALLHRYSNQSDVLVGTPIANRQRPETKHVIGMFINTAVMRAEVTGDMTFRQLVAQAKQAALNALANQDLPFDVLVQAIRPERDLSLNPLFQSMFVFRSDSVARTLPGLAAEPLPVDRGVAKFDLTMFAGEEDGGLLAALEYNSDLFDGATAQRILEHWQNLLQAIVADPDQPIATIPLLSAAEEELILRAWNDTPAPLADSRCLHEIIGEHARLSPDAAAVIAAGERLTYAALDARANRLAHRLLERGVASGTPVGLYVERSADMLVGILGILKAGGAYVPLEPSYPEERIRHALQDSGAPVVVTQQRLRDALPATTAMLVVLDAEPDAGSEGPAEAAQLVVSLDDLAYIIYTSGSTGTPKGVMVTHRNLLASTMARLDYYVEPVSRYLLLSSFAFDSSVAGIFWTLAGGGALVLPEPDEEKDVARLAGLIAGEGVTHTLALPTLYRLLLAYAPPGSLASLRAVIVAGEACPTNLGESHYRLLRECRLYNEYGPTEATVWCSVYQLPPAPEDGPVPIGRPIANSRLYVLDALQQPVPIGVPGELYVGGLGVTPGYWRNPELTAERFLPDPFAAQDGAARLYRTGDLVRWRTDGQLVFLGRVDNQVKLRGFRIELGEIESRLLTYPGVTEAAVTVWEQPGPGGATDRSLIAYVTGEQLPTSASDVDARLRDHLGAALPEYMVPRLIMRLDALPHTPNGKVDYGRLPEPYVEQAAQAAIVAPRTATEASLARIWSDILRLPEVSVEDGFFALGGDSLMSIQVIARARQEGIVITPRQLFREQTIARLAAVATTAGASPRPATTAPGPVPLTPIQHWFFDQKLAQPAHWNQAVWFETDAEIDVDALEAALNAVAAHHPMLRARYRQDGDGWQQEITGEPGGVPLTRMILAGQTPVQQDAELLAAANRLHAGLDLTDGPLARATWFYLGPERRPRLLLTVHHLVIDAVSWTILVPDINEAYRQIAAGKPVVLPPSPASYREWAELQARLAPDVAQREAPYWRTVAAKATPLSKDGSAADGNNSEGASGLVTVSLDSARTETLLRDAHKAYNTRIEDLLLAALARAMGEWHGGDTTLLTLERHGREEMDQHLDVSRTVGWFTSLFPLALTLPSGDDDGAAIRAVKEQVRAVPQNGLGYGILRYLGDEATRRTLAEQPQPQVLFNYLGVAPQPDTAPAPLRRIFEPTGQVYGLENTRAHLIDVNAQIRDGRLVARWQFAPALCGEDRVAVAESFVAHLARLVDHCLAAEQGQHTPSDFPLADLEQADLDGLADLLAGLE